MIADRQRSQVEISSAAGRVATPASGLISEHTVDTTSVVIDGVDAMSDSFDPVAVAHAFSKHMFADAFAHLDAEISWTIVGYAVLKGVAAVKQMCRDTQRSLHGITTTSDRCITVAQGRVVVVDTIRRYAGPDCAIVVAACDIYEFVGHKVAAITSYALEVDPECSGAPP